MYCFILLSLPVNSQSSTSLAATEVELHTAGTLTELPFTTNVHTLSPVPFLHDCALGSALESFTIDVSMTARPSHGAALGLDAGD